MSDHKYVAFDVHKSTITVVVLNLEGKILTQAVIQTDANSVRHFLCGLSAEVHLRLEEGTHAQWLYELSRRLVSHLIVCNARLIKSRGKKSDRLDALKLAQHLRAGLLKGVYHPKASSERLKQLVHNYDCLTEDTTRCMNR